MFRKKKKTKIGKKELLEKIGLNYAYISEEAICIIIEYNGGIMVFSPFYDGLKFDLISDVAKFSVKEQYTSCKKNPIHNDFSSQGVSLTYAEGAENGEVVNIKSISSHYTISFENGILVSIEAAKNVANFIF